MRVSAWALTSCFGFLDVGLEFLSDLLDLGLDLLDFLLDLVEAPVGAAFGGAHVGAQELEQFLVVHFFRFLAFVQGAATVVLAASTMIRLRPPFCQ